MIHPSYVDLMNIVNEGAEDGETPVINSRYSIVMATAKRARQLVDGDAPMIDDTEGMKPLAIAVKELEQGKLRILPQDEDEIEKEEEEDIREAKALETGSLRDGVSVADDLDDEDETDGSESGEEAAGSEDAASSAEEDE